MPVLAIIIALPVLLSLVLLFSPLLQGKTIKHITILAFLTVLAGVGYVLHGQAETWQLLLPSHYPTLLHRFSHFLVFGTEGTSGLMLLLFTIMMGVLVLNVLAYNCDIPGENRFYPWLLFTAGLGFAIFTATHFYVLIFMWGVSSIPLFFLGSGFKDDSASPGKLALIMFGGAHVLMVTGAVMAVSLSGSADISSIQTETSTASGIISFLLLLAGGLAAIGVFPLHSWIIPYAKFASIRSFALMPLVFQRLTGTYLLIRLCHDMFILSEALRALLLSLGFISSILTLAVALAGSKPMLRLVNLYMAMGGMILAGIATGTQAGILAALIYVVAGGVITMPFFFASSINRDHLGSSFKATYELPKMGKRKNFRRRKFLLTLLSGTIPAGVFAANILLFRGLWEFADTTGMGIQMAALWILPAILVAGGIFATSISFVKTNIHKVIPEGQNGKGDSNISFVMMIAPVVVSIFSVLLLFTPLNQWVISFIGAPAVEPWQSGYILLASGSFIASLILGIALLILLPVKGKRLLIAFSQLDESPCTDIYKMASKVVFAIHRPLSRMHDGVLQTYLVWVAVAMIILFLLK